jgi:hypothetical protein
MPEAAVFNIEARRNVTHCDSFEMVGFSRCAARSHLTTSDARGVNRTFPSMDDVNRSGSAEPLSAGVWRRKSSGDRLRREKPIG